MFLAKIQTRKILTHSHLPYTCSEAQMIINLENGGAYFQVRVYRTVAFLVFQLNEKAKLKENKGKNDKRRIGLLLMVRFILASKNLERLQDLLTYRKEQIS